MSYTKGPWIVQGGMVWASFKRLNRAKQEYVESAIVADTWHSKKLPDDEKEANAHLISAAPELLETVKALLEIRGLVDGLPLHIYDMAQEVIAKAEGHQDSES